MGFSVVKLAEVATCKSITFFTDITELSFFTATMHSIEDVVVLVGIDYLCHTHTLPYGFLKTLSEPDFKKRPPTPHKKL